MYSMNNCQNFIPFFPGNKVFPKLSLYFEVSTKGVKPNPSLGNSIKNTGKRKP
jgi:hypothetical protein